VETKGEKWGMNIERKPVKMDMRGKIKLMERAGFFKIW